MSEPTPDKPSAAPRTIRGDVGPAGGDVSHAGPLEVGGTLRDGMTIEVGGDLSVGGSIEAAAVRALGGITVAGSIAGRGKGLCFCTGPIRFRIGNGATIEASGDVHAEIEITSSRIITFGKLLCEKGQVHGGRITASGGITCDKLGSPAGIPTLVEAGIDERLRRLGKTRAAQISRNCGKIREVRSQIEPLLTHAKSLSPSQKERATELLCQASEMEQETEKLVQALTRVVSVVRACGRSEVNVTGTLYAGVTIRLGAGVETRIGTNIAGPVKIWCKPAGRSHQVLLTELATNSVHPLETIPYSDTDLAALDRALAPESSPRGARSPKERKVA